LPVTLGDSHSGMAVSGWFVQGLPMEALVRDQAGHQAAAKHALARAFELAARDRVMSPFLVDPVPDLLERYASRDPAHADLISKIFELRTGLERRRIVNARSSHVGSCSWLRHSQARTGR
jgi:hypothetical protein